MDRFAEDVAGFSPGRPGGVQPFGDASLTRIPPDALDLVPLGILALVILLLACTAAAGESAEDVGPGDAASPARVWVEGRRLLVEGRAFAMHGVVWSPAGRDTNTWPADLNNVAVRRGEFARWMDLDIPLLKAMHVNTVRLVLDPGITTPELASGRRLLDALHAAGIRVVMNADAGVNDLGRIAAVVPQYRDHPALLLWMLGSEWNQNLYFGLAATPQEAAERTERAAALVRRLDPFHPVAASLGDIHLEAEGRRLADTERYVNRVCPSVDLWGLNVYRGRSFGKLFDQWAAISDKPMFLAEFGVDAWASRGMGPDGAPDQSTQADWDLALWQEIRAHLSAFESAGPESRVAVGGTLFEWNDEWWKLPPPGSQETGGLAAPGQQPDQVANEEWFGLVEIDRRPRLVYQVLREAFSSMVEPALP